VSEKNLVALTTKLNVCKMKNASDNPTLWYAEPEHIHQQIQKAVTQKKFEAEMNAQRMPQIPEEYKVAMQAIWVIPMVHWTLKTVQQTFMTLSLECKVQEQGTS